MLLRVLCRTVPRTARPSFHLPSCQGAGGCSTVKASLWPQPRQGFPQPNKEQAREPKQSQSGNSTNARDHHMRWGRVSLSPPAWVLQPWSLRSRVSLGPPAMKPVLLEAGLPATWIRLFKSLGRKPLLGDPNWGCSGQWSLVEVLRALRLHRIMEYAESEGAHQDHWVQLPALCRSP